MTQTEPDLEAFAGDPTIKIIGLGGAGGNVVGQLKAEELGNVQLAVVNTDAKALQQSPVPDKLLIGKSVTRGLGTGGELELGREAAESDREQLAQLVAGADLVVLVAGLGGGTGSALAPLVAELAGQSEALVLSFVMLPFSFEATRLKQVADGSIGELRQRVHGLMSLPNDILIQEGDGDISVVEAFAVADRWIGRGIRSLCSMLLKTGMVNQDLRSLCSVFQERGGRTVFGIGYAEGENYVARALEDLTMCPLLHLGDRPKQLDRLLINITGGANLGLTSVHTLVSRIAEQFGSREDVVFGAVIDPERRDSLEICLLGKMEMDRPRLKASHKAEPDSGGAPQAPGLGLLTEISQDGRKPRPVHRSKLARKKKAGDADQDEFDFIDDSVQRGYFEQTDRNEYKGEDLDVPTYLRRGIKINLK
jgi:cell division protein FtsZ